MPNLFLEKSIEIDASVAQVWGAITEPGWEVDKEIEGRGKILKFEPEKILKHNTLRLAEGVSLMTSIVTYELRPEGEKTMLFARESFAEAQSDKAFKEASDRWDARLAELKKKAEG